MWIKIWIILLAILIVVALGSICIYRGLLWAFLAFKSVSSGKVPVRKLFKKKRTKNKETVMRIKCFKNKLKVYEIIFFIFILPNKELRNLTVLELGL